MNDSSTPAVLHIVWNLIRGGTEGQCARVTMQLARAGQRHRVAVFRREGFFLDAVEQACGPVYHFDVRSIRSWRTLVAIRQLADFIRRERFDMVHCWDADAVIFGSAAARWAGVPFLTSRRDLSAIYPAYKLALMKRADHKAAAVIVNAEAIRQWVQETVRLSPSRIVRIPNILDVDEFDALFKRSYEGLPEGGAWVAVVARLDPEKDTDTVLRAAAILKASHPDVRFAIAGDGRERERLERLAVELGVTDCVRFLGDVQAVPSLLSRCAIGVLAPKANEGLSNTILEYMAARLPVVATDCGGNAELVRHEQTGFVVPIGDAAALAAQIARCLDDPTRARGMGEAGRAVIEESHRPETVAAEFARLYAASLR